MLAVVSWAKTVDVGASASPVLRPTNMVVVINVFFILFLLFSSSWLYALRAPSLELSWNCAAPLTAYYVQKENGNGNEHTTKFRHEAVRVVLTSGLTRKEVASDCGVHGLSGNAWILREFPLK